MGGVMVAAVLLGALMLVARQFREGRLRAPNLAGMALLVALTVSVPLVMPKAMELGSSRYPPRTSAGRETLPRATEDAAATSEDAARTGLLGRAAAHAGKVRRRFTEMYSDAGSNVDADVQFHGAADLARYLPRAAAVGFFAPFPDMWLAPGKKVGSAGRLVGGLESLGMYAVECLALLGLWRGRRRLSAWLLLSVAATGLTALGLVVVNVGALFRLRYVFLILLIILAAEGAAGLLERLSKRPRVLRAGGFAG
jgi:hypothetical protein